MHPNGLNKIVVLAVLLCCVATHDAAARVIAEAYAGELYGVGRVVVTLDDPSAAICAATSSWEIRDPEHRIHYPVFSNDKLAQLFELFTGEKLTHRPMRFQTFFLFRGDRPLQLTMYTPEKITFSVTPTVQPIGYRRTLRRWWRERQNVVKLRKRVTDYPPLVDEYLTAVLAARLGIQTTPVRLTDWSPKQATGLLLGSEKQHLRAFREVVHGCSECEAANLPVPAARTWVRDPLPEFELGEIEPIARYVPDDCFYARFGSFSNFYWLSKLTEEYGGDLSRMITLRGNYPRYGERIEEQLGIKDLPFAEQIGDKLIQDMAFIGRDLFLREGAAVGVVIHSRNPLFPAGLFQLRKDQVKQFADEGAALVDVEIGGKEVSLLSTRGNRILSYHVRRGQFHLISNCRQIVESFLEIEDGAGSLAEDSEFQYARSQFSVQREDTIFGFVSRRCLEQLASPAYQIELHRRLRAVAEMEAVQLARLAYASDFRRGGEVDAAKQLADVAELAAAGYLPKSFGQRADGSHVELEGADIRDTLRGLRGSFLPIPDTQVIAVTTREAMCQQHLNEFFAMQAPALSPLCIALRRQILDENESVERVSLEARVAPFRRSNYHLVNSMLGQAITEHAAAPDNSVVYANFVVRGPSLSSDRQGRHVTLAMPDLPPTLSLKSGGLLSWMPTVRALPLTVAATNDVELLRKYAGLLGNRDDAQGYAQLPLRIWRRRMEDYTAYSFDRLRLEELLTPIPLAEADRPAQFRVSIGDLAGSRFASGLNAIACDRALRASLGNIQMVHDLSNQFHVPRQQALDVAQRLLSTQLICSLGGEYEVIGHKSGLQQWTSTSCQLSPEVAAVTGELYTAPLMKWLRGLQLEAAIHDDHASLIGHVDVERIELPKERGKKASVFDLFKGKGKDKSKKKKSAVEKE